jgi:hypothetical protein
MRPSRSLRDTKTDDLNGVELHVGIPRVEDRGVLRGPTDGSDVGAR